MSKFSKSIAILICYVLATFMPTMATADWSITGLGTLGGTKSYAYSINDSGRIAGNSLTFHDTAIHTFITGPSGGGMTDLGIPSLINEWYGINDSGRVVSAIPMPIGGTHAFITGPNGVGMTDLGTLPGGNSSDALGINNSGQVVGTSNRLNPYGDFILHAFITGPNGVGMTDLGTLGGMESHALGINDSGQVVGYSEKIPGSYISHAFITGPNGVGMTDLGTLGGKDSFAYSINKSGQVVGGSSTASSYIHHAFITGPDGIGMTDLGTLGGAMSEAYSINDSGQAVGISQVSAYVTHAFLYSDGVMLDLSALPVVVAAGWSDLTPRDINNHGQIVGYGNHFGHTEAFLLSSPVPEPQTFAMLLAGLSVLGFMTRRKKESIA